MSTIDWSKVVEQAPATPQEALEGGQAYVDKKPKTANPYPEGSKQHEDWAWGYDETQYATEYRTGPDQGAV